MRIDEIKKLNFKSFNEKLKKVILDVLSKINIRFLNLCAYNQL